jgi:hypothetical protein
MFYIDNSHSPGLGQLHNLNKRDFKSFEKTIKDLLLKKMTPVLKEDKFDKLSKKLSNGKSPTFEVS